MHYVLVRLPQPLCHSTVNLHNSHFLCCPAHRPNGSLVEPGHSHSHAVSPSWGVDGQSRESSWAFYAHTGIRTDIYMYFQSSTKWNTFKTGAWQDKKARRKINLAYLWGFLFTLSYSYQTVLPMLIKCRSLWNHPTHTFYVYSPEPRAGIYIY